AVSINHPVLAQNEDEKMVIVSTFAGSGEEGFADGEGSAAQFFYPTGIAIDAAGTLYVADWENNRIRKVTTKGEVSTLAGGEEGFADGKGSVARFDHPHGIALDTAGNLYVADSFNNRIRKVSPNGEVSTLAGDGERSFADGKGSAAQLNEPNGLTIDATGNLYVADTWNARIRKITPDGEVTTFAGGVDDGYSEGDFADGQGRNARFYDPFDITIDAEGILYVADSGNQRIRKVTPDGVVTTLAGGNNEGKRSFADGKGSKARFFWPSGIAVDAAGNLYVADTDNQRIRKVTPDGVVTTLAGSGEKGFADGEGSAARFCRPRGIAIDAEGNLYVADGNHRIRKIAIKRP
ncbi:MAG: SMP-30/gluconolactonase/LRE family protein, partial [Zoogloeaceae bacterium]|nr:SMP-30/gluconolactonase/LRE family protein [Zoogloeaceae bacterium]